MKLCFGVSGLAALTITANCASSPPPYGLGRAKVYEATTIEAHPERLEDLINFVEANWFAMDREAVAQGLMTDYRLWIETSAPDTGTGPDRLIVVVGYPTCEGYAGAAEGFDAIRKTHTIVPIAGALQISDLGRISQSRRFIADRSCIEQVEPG